MTGFGICIIPGFQVCQVSEYASGAKGSEYA